MSLPTIEVVYKPATEAFRAAPQDASLVKGTFDILSAQKGQSPLPKYFGLQHEDKATAYLAIAWDTFEDHERLMNDKEEYPRLGATTEVYFVPGAKGTMFHVRSTSEPWKALEAPVTELAVFTLKDGHSKSELEQTVDAISKRLDVLGEPAGETLASWGPTVEKDDVFALFVGWQSVEAHVNTVTTDKEIADLITKVKTLSNLDLVHVAFSK
ncbi:hypothetical protein C8Q79DRAFT_905382 [Trametes meyenii]|nr:hypothetical protein C8Q79DRAFT_905382 [Trametes meyenii]